MNLVTFLAISTFLYILASDEFYPISCTVDVAASNNTQDEYREDLFIRPLTDGKLFAQFRFNTSYRNELRHLRWENKIQIFPLSIADLVAETDLNELHFSLTKGNWRYRDWGYSTRPSPPGAQIRVQFPQHNKNIDRSWNRLINSLAGKFCASLTSADKNSIVRSKLAFGQDFIYVNLPEETFCTENLTPWRKLLPCYQNSGLASLLNAAKLLESSYSSLAMDLEHKNGRVHLIQTLTIVFNPLKQFEGKQMWSLAKVFGNSISKACPIASDSKITVDTTNLDDKSNLYPQSFKLKDERYAVFDVKSILTQSNTQLNIGVKQTQLFKRPAASSRPTLPVYLNTHVVGVGAADGAIVATISNKHQQPLRVTYMDSAPHFLRTYLHTLKIRTSSGQELEPDKLNFKLSEGTSPTMIEFNLVIPAGSDVKISYEFERTFLRWSDYKPDANKGVLISSAQISFALQPSDSQYSVMLIASDGKQQMGRIYARPLLIILPTPDFSMPYNVICLVSTVLVAAFGPLHSMTTTKPLIRIDKKTQ